MPRPARAAMMLTAAAALLALQACGERKPTTAELTAADHAAAPPPKLTFELATADARGRLELQDTIANYPELHRALFEARRQRLQDFARTAAEDRPQLIRKGAPDRGPYERRESWRVAAVTPRLISLKGTWFADTGGAHPNHGSEALLWDRERNAMILPAELFRPDYDLSQLDGVLCEAVTRVKTERMGPTDPRSWSCPKWADSRFVLAPSTRPYRIGGLRFLFDPYVIGPYAEGDYEAVIPQAAFRAAVAPAWAAEFVGEPAPSPGAPPVPRGARR